MCIRYGSRITVYVVYRNWLISLAIDALEFTAAWARILAGSNPWTWTHGPTSNWQACCDGAMQGQTSQWWCYIAMRLDIDRDRYWEAKLAPGHMPSEAKIENFIRTKYESKRWVMDGPMPDPSTLEVDGDDDVVSIYNFVLILITTLTISAPERCPREGKDGEICFSETSCASTWAVRTISYHSPRSSGRSVRR